MTETTLTAQADYLIGVAARAPSLHNTQPWRFKVSDARDRVACRRQPPAPGGPRRPGDAHQLRRGALRAAARGALAGVPARGRTAPRAGPRHAAAARPGAAGPAAPMTPDERQMLRRCRTGTPTAARSSPARCPPGCSRACGTTPQAEGATLTDVDARARPREAGRRSSPASSRRQDLDPGVTGRDTAVEPRGQRARPGTACPLMPSPLCPAASPAGCPSATSTSAGASAC